MAKNICRRLSHSRYLHSQSLRRLELGLERQVVEARIPGEGGGGRRMEPLPPPPDERRAEAALGLAR